MTVSKAISTRIINICKEKNISINKLANASFLTQSTLQSIIVGDSNNPKLLTISRVCYGLDITLEEFFSDEVFNDLDLNI
ncbi:MAG: helix-turn-helix domain-containing protein [Clostridia bacterium]